MNTNQDLKMQLLKEFGISDDKKTVDFCREAYKFLIEGDLFYVKDVDGNGMPIMARTIADNNAVAPADTTAPAEPQAIDLGLPSGTLWCDRNVGASSPSDYGAFFSWGNTEPHFPRRDKMDWGDDDEAFGDYSFDGDTYEETEGYKLDGDIDLAHDAARVNMGEPWQMPTDDQFLELYDNCNWIRKTLNGVNGYLVVSKINGNAVFFAACGYGSGSSWDYRGAVGYYWSRSFSSGRYARDLYFNSSGVHPQLTNYRYDGFAVRPVQNIIRPTE